MFKKKTGYTLLEITLVLSLMSIVLIVVPNFHSLNEYLKIKQSIKQFESDINNTQRLSFDTDTEYIIFLLDDGYLIDNNKNSFFTPYYKKLKYIKDSYSDNKIIFLKDGTPKYSGEIGIKNELQKNIIKLKIKPATGRVDIKW